MQEEMFCAIRAMMRKQNSHERGEKEKLLPIPLADQPPVENLLSSEAKHLAENL